MSSRHSVPIAGAPLGIGVYADGVASRNSATAARSPLGRPGTKVPVQKPFRLTGRRQPAFEDAIRSEARYRERARIVCELHDTLLQGFLGASMLLHQAMEQHLPTPLLSPRSVALCAWSVGRLMKAARRYGGFK